MESEEITKRERTCTSNQVIEDNKINESVKVVFSIDQDKRYCDSTGEESYDRDVDIDIDIDVMLENDRPHISVTVCKKGLASDMITIRKLSCSNCDQWERCVTNTDQWERGVTEDIRGGDRNQHYDSKLLIYKKGENHKSTGILSEDVTNHTTLSKVDSAGQEKKCEEVEMSFKEIINEYNRIFNRPSNELTRLRPSSIDGGQIENISTRFAKWCQQAEIRLEETKAKAKEQQRKQVKRKVALDNGLRYQDPISYRQTRIPTRVPTQKLENKYPTAVTIKETEIERTESSNGRERNTPTDKLIDEHSMTTEIQNTEKDFRDKRVEVERVNDIEQEHAAIGFATDISVDEYLKSRGMENAVSGPQHKDIPPDKSIDEYPQREETSNIGEKDGTPSIGSVVKETEFPTEETLDQYLKPRETTITVKEQRGGRGVKLTQIPIRIPTEKLTEGYLKPREALNIQNGARSSRIESKASANDGERQRIISDLTNTSFRKHHTSSDNERTDDEEVKSGTGQCECLYNNKENLEELGARINAAKSGLILSSLENNTNNNYPIIATTLHADKPIAARNKDCVKHIEIGRTLSVITEEETMATKVKNTDWKFAPKLKQWNGQFAEIHASAMRKDLQSIINRNKSREVGDLDTSRKLSVISEEEIQDDSTKRKSVSIGNPCVDLFTRDTTNTRDKATEEKYLSGDIKFQRGISHHKTKYDDSQRARRCMLIKGLPTEENDTMIPQHSKDSLKQLENLNVVRRNSRVKRDNSDDVTHGRNKETEDIERIQKLDELIKTLWPEEKNEYENIEIQNTELINLFDNTSFSDKGSLPCGPDRTHEMYPVKV